MTITGCAIGNIGSLAAHVTHADGATVVYAVGSYLRTAPDDRGLQLGETRGDEGQVLVRQAKLGVSCRVQVPVGRGVGSDSS